MTKPYITLVVYFLKTKCPEALLGKEKLILAAGPYMWYYDGLPFTVNF